MRPREGEGGREREREGEGEGERGRDGERERREVPTKPEGFVRSVDCAASSNIPT